MTGMRCKDQPSELHHWRRVRYPSRKGTSCHLPSHLLQSISFRSFSFNRKADQLESDGETGHQHHYWIQVIRRYTRWRYSDSEHHRRYVVSSLHLGSPFPDGLIPSALHRALLQFTESSGRERHSFAILSALLLSFRSIWVEEKARSVDSIHLDCSGFYLQSSTDQ